MTNMFKAASLSQYKRKVQNYHIEERMKLELRKKVSLKASLTQNNFKLIENLMKYLFFVHLTPMS